MAKKAPRRTAERILVATLELFNRFGEPNVSTTVISAELNISPGNLYYHFPSKDELVNTLFDQYEARMVVLLAASDDVRDVEDAWFFLHTLFELIWAYRFLYRDLNHLLSRNRRLETHFPAILTRKKGALRVILDQLLSPEASAREDVLETQARMVLSPAMATGLPFEGRQTGTLAAARREKEAGAVHPSLAAADGDDRGLLGAPRQFAAQVRPVHGSPSGRSRPRWLDGRSGVDGESRAK